MGAWSLPCATSKLRLPKVVMAIPPRHLRNWAIRQIWNPKFSQGRVCHISVLRLNQVVGINRRTAEEAREHNIETAGPSGAREHQIVGNNAQVRSQPEHIPRFLPKNR